MNYRYNTFASGLSLSSKEPSSAGPRENKASKQKHRIRYVNDMVSFQLFRKARPPLSKIKDSEIQL